jgi:GT2 family glycosyltransferase/glycosyltransferase involved in cell wall biosynthesis
VLDEIIREWGVGAVLVSSLIGLGLDLLRTGLPTVVCTHDVFPLWPLLHDTRDPGSQAFDLAALEQGLLHVDATFPFRNRDACGWMTLRAGFIGTVLAMGVGLVAPSEFARRRFLAIAPVLANARWDILPHGVTSLPRLPPPPPRPGARLRVLVPGRIHGEKGERLLQAMLAGLPADVELVLLGSGYRGGAFWGRGNVEVILDYAHASLADEVARIAPDLALLPSTVPETFSYMLSEVLALGLPVLCAAPGAPAERLAALGRGWVLPPDAARVNAKLTELAANRSLLERERALPTPRQPDLAAMAEAWRHRLPGAAAPLRLAAATPDTLRRITVEHVARALAGQLSQSELALAAARRELEARAEAAHRAQREIEALQATQQGQANDLEAAAAREVALAAALASVEEQLASQARSLAAKDAALAAQAGALADREAALSAAAVENAGRAREIERLELERNAREGELDRLRETLGQREHDLAAARDFHQHERADLIRQRDVAVAQRDEALAHLERVFTGRTWRATALPRALAAAIGNQRLALAYRARHLRMVAGRVLASLRTRGLAGTWQRIRERRAARATGRPAFAAPAADLRQRPLQLAAVDAPRASIIVPAFEQLDYTLACLHSLAACGDRTPFEVIVVDDASGDATPGVLPGIPGLRYLRNEANLGFIGACNAGAAAARGEFLVFLNNDTTVRPGWLDALLDTFESHPDTGLAGSQLVYPDGRLQEAGGIVFSDGSGWNYGRFDDPAHPRYGFVREVDYCSGASIALRRDLFAALGGFDAHYAPAYYEDTDLAMRVRAAGLKVRYQPASVVVHHEGVSSGTDIAQGVKQHQATNQVKFLARWREVLAAQHAPPGTDPVLASERGRRHRVLVLDACTPHPDRDSGSVRMLALLRLLREAGCAVSFFNEDRSHDDGYTRALQQLGVEAWWTPYLADVPRWLKAEGPRFDLVIASRHYVLSPLLPLLRRHAPRARVVFDTVDLHYLREQREAEISGDDAMRRAAERTRRGELALIAAADATWVVSAAEKALLEAEIPGARVAVVSNIHDVTDRGAPFAQRQGLLFVGSYRHPPNVDAARWLADEIFPRIRRQSPAIELHLVGADAPPEVVALGERDGIRFHGHVPDLQPLLDSARISVAPLRYGAGVKGKVNQALALGLPVVATTCAVEGMFLTDGNDVLVADEAEAFADAVLRLHEDAALWERLSLGGQENTRRHFSTAAVRQVLDALLATLPGR